ncbi:PEP-CTERM sorting domain-containing protein [Dapis sp. BLCC M126]|uniref:PEP-CTERM sorting domain-containing protein n=1 Tax=Dapis sp. BLCC M126 TaxID=3400189 RepID=UPI003CE6B9E6
MNYYVKSLLCSLGAAVSLNTLMVNNASAFTLSDSVSGNVSPPTVLAPSTVTNGDFLITLGGRGSVVGDGADDITSWIFDFTDSPLDIPSPSNLESALFTLTITPRSGGIISDQFQIIGLDLITSPDIRTTPLGETNTVILELLDFYSSDQILGVFTGDINGQIPFEYRDDAIVSFASLDLTFKQVPGSSSVPEPTSTLSLLILGTLGVVSTLKFKLNASKSIEKS